MNHLCFLFTGAIGALLFSSTSNAAINQGMAAASNDLRLLPLQNVGHRGLLLGAEAQGLSREDHSAFVVLHAVGVARLRKAAGQKVEGELNGTWGEANLHKFLETAAYSLAHVRDPALEREGGRSHRAAGGRRSSRTATCTST